MLRALVVRLSHPFLRRWYERWNSKPRLCRYDGLDLIVLPGVFHPGLFVSTGVLSRYVASLDLRGKSFLELGSGTGRVALVAARNGAGTTASDINPQAVRNAGLNAERNNLPLTCTQSDLFDALPGHFDVIAINPPYYQRDPRNDAELAFFAGADLGYFHRLFAALPARLGAGSRVITVISLDVDLTSITAIATAHGLTFTELERATRWGETQAVFAISATS